VPTIALEEIGVPFETELIRTEAKHRKTPEFLAIFRSFDDLTILLVS
jgi:glutathione S-transferase